MFPALLFAAAAALYHDEATSAGKTNASSATKAPERFTTSRTSAIDLPLPEEKDAFVFCVYGDRTGGPVEGIEVLAQAVAETNLIAPDLVMTVGDLVQGYNDAPQWLKQMEEFKRTMNALGSPWFPVAGNHDVYWRGKGERPNGGNGALFEANFAPLWYAFEHKNSWFIALYSDEGDPATGEQAFDKPNCQRMSDAQFAWLSSALARAKGADHVFLFLHHPRWLGGGYGDDWERVHGLLKSAGNVSAVFAGHIHHMRYDGQRDGIEYFALATVGGDQSGIAAAAGYLHEFHVVTVRKDRVSLATLPVGTVMDPREITGQVSDEVTQLSRALPTELANGLAFSADESASGPLKIALTNPTKRSVDLLLEGDSDDARWNFAPDHVHAKLGAGESRTFTFDVARPAHAVDASLRLPELVLRAEYLAKGLRIPLPERRLAIPLDTHAVALPVADAKTEHVLALDGENDALSIPARVLTVPDGPFTIEGWLRATKAFKKREGFLCKTESSDFGLFVGDGIPDFKVHLGGKYANATAPEPLLALEKWCHVAGVFDGAELRLYVDGRRVASQAATGVRRTNDLPLFVGADVTSSGGPSAFFDGELDEVRVSKSARYTGERFVPERRHASDADTLLLLHMDGDWGPWIPDASGAGRHALKVGHPRVN